MREERTQERQADESGAIERLREQAQLIEEGVRRQQAAGIAHSMLSELGEVNPVAEQIVQEEQSSSSSGQRSMAGYGGIGRAQYTPGLPSSSSGQQTVASMLDTVFINKPFDDMSLSELGDLFMRLKLKVHRKDTEINVKKYITPRPRSKMGYMLVISQILSDTHMQLLVSDASETRRNTQQSPPRGVWAKPAGDR